MTLTDILSIAVFALLGALDFFIWPLHRAFERWGRPAHLQEARWLGVFLFCTAVLALAGNSWWVVVLAAPVVTLLLGGALTCAVLLAIGNSKK